MVAIQKMVLTLNVPSIEATIEWYERVLEWRGHQDVWDQAGNCLFGSVGYRTSPFEGFNLSRSLNDQALPASQCDHCQVWFYCDDVDWLYEKVTHAGVQVNPPQDQFWGDRTFQMRDINGFELIFAHSVEDVGLEQIRARHRGMLQEKDEAENAD